MFLPAIRRYEQRVFNGDGWCEGTAAPLSGGEQQRTSPADREG